MRFPGDGVPLAPTQKGRRGVLASRRGSPAPGRLQGCPPAGPLLGAGRGALQARLPQEGVSVTPSSRAAGEQWGTCPGEPSNSRTGATEARAGFPYSWACPASEDTVSVQRASKAANHSPSSPCSPDRKQSSFALQRWPNPWVLALSEAKSPQAGPQILQLPVPSFCECFRRRGPQLLTPGELRWSHPVFAARSGRGPGLGQWTHRPPPLWLVLSMPRGGL